ncbi:hypothetical protein CHS0354_029056, partial [Potamilus streckersoni]
MQQPDHISNNQTQISNNYIQLSNKQTGYPTDSDNHNQTQISNNQTRYPTTRPDIQRPDSDIHQSDSD